MYNDIDKASTRGILENIASKFEKDLQATLLKIFAILKSELSLQKVLRALREGGVTSLLLLLQDWEDIIGSSLLTVLQENIIKSGRFFVGNLPKGSVSRVLPVTMFNPGTIQILNQYGARLIKDISDTSKEVIRQQLEANIIAGRNPNKAAIDIRESIGLTPNLLAAVQRYRAALETQDSAKITEMLNDSRNNLRDHRFDGQLKSLLSGKKAQIPQEVIERMVNRYRERLIKYRAETIARTESLRALSMAEYESIIEANLTGSLNNKLRRFWIHAKDERVRQSHIEIPLLNKDGVLVNEPFQTPLGTLRYPRDIQGLPENVINCRCTLGYRIVR